MASSRSNVVKASNGYAVQIGDMVALTMSAGLMDVTVSMKSEYLKVNRVFQHIDNVPQILGILLRKDQNVESFQLTC
jgi:hypothetical protein